MCTDWLFQVTRLFHSGCQQGVTKSPGELRVFLKDLMSFQCLTVATLSYWNQMLGTTFVFLELSRLGTVSLACKNKHQFPTLKLSSLGHHPHDPGYGNSLHQPPKLWNQNCLFRIFLLFLFCSLSKTRPSDLWYLSMRILWQCKVKKRFLSIALNEDAHEHSFPCRNSPCGGWEPARTLARSCFSLSPPFIYEFLFHALGPFQVGLDFLSISSCPCCVYLQLSSMANIKKEDNVPFSCFHPFSSY